MTMYKEVIDVFIFKDFKKQNEGAYSMYLCCMNGVLLYEGIDRKDLSNLQHVLITPDFHSFALSPGSIDCTAEGKLLFN